MASARIWSTEEWIEHFGTDRKATIVTIGNFDGVHLGHRAILQRVTREARATGRMSAVLTFYPHPARVLRPAAAPLLLETMEQRLSQLAEAKVESVLIVRFNRELSELRPQDFAQRFLADALRAAIVLVGENFRFGHRQEGNVSVLRELGGRMGFAVETVPPVLDSAGRVISSSAIRLAVREGRMEDAARMLGQPFALAGEIRAGTGVGRKVVVPTLNLATAQETLPKLGVYATETTVAGGEYRSVTNVGTRPTFDGTNLAIESHLFDFSESLTSGAMTVRFRARIRDEKKFSGPEELKKQILRDIDETKRYFATSA